MQLDYSLSTAEARTRLVEQIIAETPADKLTKTYLSHMSDYILFIGDKNQTKKERNQKNPIITKNREITVNKRQVSFEEVVSGLENGEDGLYALITNDKNQILDPKEPITDIDLDEIPGLREQVEVIQNLEQQFQSATGPRKFSLKKQIIETWRQIYILKAGYKNAPARGHTSNQIKTMAHMQLEENITLNPQTQMPEPDGVISLLNPAHISFLLCYYSQLKQECCDDTQSDMFYLLLDLEQLTQDALLPDNERLYNLIIWKIDGLTNEEIKQQWEAKYGEVHSEQYFSTVWRKRIPKMLAETAQRQWLIWYYTNIEYGKWKYCRGCGQYKLEHPMFFARNSSKSGYYSLCKECKNKRSK